MTIENIIRAASIEASRCPVGEKIDDGRGHELYSMILEIAKIVCDLRKEIERVTRTNEI